MTTIGQLWRAAFLPTQANAEKLRLETKQRAARKAADQGVPIKPRWFKKNNVEMGEGLAFEYAGGYWESRKAGNFEGCRDIFGQWRQWACCLQLQDVLRQAARRCCSVFWRRGVTALLTGQDLHFLQNQVVRPLPFAIHELLM